MSYQADWERNAEPLFPPESDEEFEAKVRGDEQARILAVSRRLETWLREMPLERTLSISRQPIGFGASLTERRRGSDADMLVSFGLSTISVLDAITDAVERMVVPLTQRKQRDTDIDELRPDNDSWLETGTPR